MTQFLVELDQCAEGVIVVGTTPAAAQVDPAMLRSGRLEQARFMFTFIHVEFHVKPVS